MKAFLTRRPACKRCEREFFREKEKDRGSTLDLHKERKNVEKE